MDKPRVRFAPSPTGPLHLGGVRTALYNYLLARRDGGTFILRIEDTDQERFVEGAEQYIIDTLTWCGLDIDEGPHVGGPYGPYRQSERKPMYRQYADQLIASGNAYYAFDTQAELEEMRERLTKQGVPSPKYDAVTRQYMKNSLTLPEDVVKENLANNVPYVIRIKVPRNEDIRFEDEIRGWVTFQSNQLDDKVLFKSDGMPTYHMANVVDDYLMKITHVIRGEEWLPSAPTHVLLYRFFGWENVMPKFAHLPLILRPDGNGKLSKRDGDRLGFPVFALNWTNPETGEQSTGFRERGFFPGAFLNMLALLGWNPGTTQEIFSKEELVQAFTIDRIGKSGAKFDFEKAKWFNQQYFKLKTPEELVVMVKPILAEKRIERSEAFLTEFCRLMVERVTFVNDFWEQGKFFFQLPDVYDEKTLAKKLGPGRKEIFYNLVENLEKLTIFAHDAVENEVKLFMANNNLGPGDVLPVIRILVTGTMQGPPIFETAALLGKEETLNRIKLGLKKFDELAQKV